MTDKQLHSPVRTDSPRPLLGEACEETRRTALARQSWVRDHYHDRLAQEGLAREKKDTDLEAETEAELRDLRQAGSLLYQAALITTQTEDELNARLRDMRKSRDHRWYRLNPPANGSIDLEERQSRHFAQGLSLYKLLLVCFVGSFAGVVMETIWCLLRYGYYESRAGLVYGPFNLLYGFGAVVLTVALYRFRNRGYWLSLLSGMAVGSAVEYLCSWAQEALLGSRSWDYSAMPFNLNGRICLMYSFFWGLLGVLWIKDLYPRMAKWILKLPNRAGKILTWVLTAFLVVNSLISCVAVWRWAERVEGHPAPNGFWELVDERFPDERMERVFANMKFGGQAEG